RAARAAHPAALLDRAGVLPRADAAPAGPRSDRRLVSRRRARGLVVLAVPLERPARARGRAPAPLPRHRVVARDRGALLPRVALERALDERPTPPARVRGRGGARARAARGARVGRRAGAGALRAHSVPARRARDGRRARRGGASGRARAARAGGAPA